MHVFVKMVFILAVLFVFGNSACSGGTGSGGDGGLGDGSTDSDTDGDTDGDADADGDADGDNICETLNVNAAPLPPRVMILQDLSSSLNTGAGGRWDTLKEAMEQVVDTYDQQFALGLVPFPTTYLDDPENENDNDCTVTRSHVISPSVGNATAIKDKVYGIDRTDLVGGTPTHAGFEEAREVLVGQDPNDGSERVIILVTDGEPNCFDGTGSPSPGDPGEPTEDQQRVTDDIVDLHDNDDVTVYVVGYDLDTGLDEIMDTWADEGGTGTHYAANTENTLLTQMGTIAAGLAPCEYTLEDTVPDPEYVRVRIDGVSKPYNNLADGWTLGDDDKTITLNGAACDLVRDGGSHNLKITVECEKVILE